MHLLSGQSTFHIPSWLMPQHSQTWNHSPHFQWLTLGKDKWEGRTKTCMDGAEIFPMEESILWICNLMRTVEQFSIAVRKWQVFYWWGSLPLGAFFSMSGASIPLLLLSLCASHFLSQVSRECTCVCHRTRARACLQFAEDISVAYFPGLCKPGVHVIGFPFQGQIMWRE